MENLIEKQPFHLAQTLIPHSAAVRSLAVQGNYLITGSIDKTCKLYRKENGKYNLINEINIFDDYILSLYITDDCKHFIIGCKNGHIYILDQEGNPINDLEGHKGPVNSLSCFGSRLISGSWDATANVWDLETGSKLYSLEGHAYAVCVLALENDVYITGSQDTNLNIWEGKKKVKTVNKAHQEIIRELVRYGEIGFASCSNDEMIKVWSLSGELITTLMGHSAFVFTISQAPEGRLISGGEDRSLRIWQHDDCFQTIFHPSTVWVVRADKDGDILTACGDSLARVFSCKANYKATEEETDEFEKTAEMAGAQSHDGLSEAELAKLPSVDQLKRIKGKKDGEIKIFKNGNTPEAFVWKQEIGSWEKVGEVIGNKTSKFYDGDRFFQAGEYDYVFEVDDESGIPKKLPFNADDNPLESAEKFIAREGLHKGYIEQITTFIRQNTRPGGKPSSGPSKSGSSTQAKKSASKSSSYFPYMNPVLYEGGNFDGLSKKIFEFNEALKDTPHQMKEAEVNRLNKVLEKLKDTENYYQTTFTELETEVITLKLLKWPSEYLVPVLDLFRLFLIHHNSEKLFSGLDCGLAYLSLICQVLRATTSDVVLVLCLKILCNLMKHLNNKTSLMKYQDMIVEALENINIQKKEKDTVRSALASFAFNLSTGANVASDLAIEKLIGLISEALKYENNQENIFKYLIGYGNILVLNPTGLAVASSIGLKNIIQNINVTADNSQGCKTDLINWLSQSSSVHINSSQYFCDTQKNKQ